MLPIIITGGPGAGKTTLINALLSAGYTTYPEVSRILIEEQSQLENGTLPWVDMEAFAELCFIAMKEQKLRSNDNDVVFLDRAIPDIFGYLKQENLAIPSRYTEECQGYHPQTFFCRPEASVYVQDDVRPYPFDEAIEIHQALIEAYKESGFEVVDVPWGSLTERVTFVEQCLHLQKVKS
ncbi:AAA family ATPase [Vibrio sp. 99-70-13A1]|uniref:AAA family ATPase n=1 Tax=Vibrio sp. 99-70-13A1 TaxID=2607601 RepID=UPI001493A7C8|nr:AAA family ATPase [Vibrio sp. 99-70-13A1]NOH96166.1 AAA family ATPase [Vibrio sp. 99-70-13A1]